GRSAMTVAAPLVFAVGVMLVVITLSSAMRTMVVPRGIPSFVSRAVFVAIRVFYRAANRVSSEFAKVDRRMAFYAPICLLVLPVVWLSMSLVGYTLMFWALGTRPLRAAYTLSGSSMFTLGYVHRNDIPRLTLSFTEAGL